MKTFPFRIARASRVSLVDQAVVGMKSAIASGFYGIGDRVLSLSEFSRRFGVSEKVSRTAYGRLVSEGWLNVRHGYGFLAASPDVRVWKGRVLYVQFCIGCYQSSLCANVQRELFKAGYRSVSIVLEDASRQSLETLEAALEDRYDIIFADCPRVEYENLFEKSGIPYVVTHGGFVARRGFGSQCKGVIVPERSFLGDMAEAVRKSGARSAAFVDASSVHDYYTVALRRIGCEVEQWRTPIPDGCGRAEGFRRGAERYFSEKLENGVRLPDLLVFNDDYVAEGALYALAKAGIEIPRDVKVITMYNKRSGLTSPLDFARIEVDPDQSARKIVAFLVACMEKRRLPRVPKSSPRFVPGSTL